MPSQCRACWRYIKANTPARSSKCLFIYMKYAGREWNDWIFSQVNTSITQRQKEQLWCNDVWALFLFVVSFLLLSRPILPSMFPLWSLLFHESASLWSFFLLIFGASASFWRFYFFSRCLKVCPLFFSLLTHWDTFKGHASSLSCHITYSGWFYLFMPLFDFNNLMQWNVSFIQL